jgi:transcription initiation factor TFIID subunit 5
LQYSYELLLQYLQKTQALVMLGIINERIIFEGTQFPNLLREYHPILLILTFQIFSATFLCAKLAVSAGQPSLISDDADVVALVGTSKDLAKQINQKEVHWGVCYSSTSVINLFVFYYLFYQNS